ncbi:MAG TPA: 30S ribosomal protein S6 [Firmicutes bacterium]|nr:30S ribosomal protein S6 [Bacillota bacterium]
MKMRKYEMMVIFRPELSDEELDAQENLLKESVESKGGKWIETVKWGKRKFAYPIMKLTEGYYYIYYFYLPGSEVLNLKNEIKLNDKILRFMIVRKEEKRSVQ